MTKEQMKNKSISNRNTEPIQNYHFFTTPVPVLEAVVHRLSVKKVFLKILQNSQENFWARVSFLIKYCRREYCNFIKKETLAQVFPCKF